MKKITAFLSVCVFCLSAMAQSGDANARTRSVGAFHAVSISGGIDLFFTQGPQSVSVSANDPAVRDKIITEVKDGVLMIYMEKNSWNLGSSKRKAYVSNAQLTGLEASGGSDVKIEGMVTADQLTISLSGGSDLKGKISAATLSIKQSGGSDVDIAGSVGNLHDEASGGSDLSGYDLVTDYCHIASSGGSDAHLTVNKELTATASGGSDIFYKGSAVVSHVVSSGSSTIVKKG